MKPFVTLIFFHISVVSSFILLEPKGCSLNITALDPEPIIVSTSKEFLYPQPDAQLVNLQAGASVLISCPGGKITVISQETIRADCQSETRLITNGKVIDFDEVTCSRRVLHTARYTGNNCELDGKEIEIGFRLDQFNFAREILVCFDDQTKITLYSVFNLTGSIGHHEKGVPRQSFVEDDFYQLGTRVKDLYRRETQRATINTLLGLPANSTKYIKDNLLFLARGHLSAKADFVYATQQSATFHYVNVAPQWQSLNGLNWMYLETDVRNYAEANGDLVVYTGTFGVTTLPHKETKKPIPLYLFVDENNNKALPVPELFWKVVYDARTERGVAFFGLNNPYEKNIDQSVFCEDVLPGISWVTFDGSVGKKGYVYACNVDEVRAFIPQLPVFTVRGLLLD